MSPKSAPQTMKPATAAKKLAIFLPATPAEFQDGTVSRAEFNELLANPPQWLIDLRLNGPHPRQEVARKLGISTSGLLRAGVSDSMTTAEIRELLENQPEWLTTERHVHAEVRDENARLKAREAEKKARDEAGR